MSSLLPLRDYQRAAIDAVHEDWAGGIRRPALVLPTGAGKTVVFSHLAAEWRAANRSRMMVLAHRDELLDQGQAKLKAVAPHLTSGQIKGPRHEVARDVIYASVQSLRSESRRNRVHDVGLIVVDECHHATAKTYRDVLLHFGCMDSGALALGVTATLARADDASLGDIWQKVSYRKDILWMMRRGYLLDVTGRRVEIDMDMDKIKRSGGDYQDGALGDALMESFAPEIVAEAYKKHAADRSGVLFAPTVASAQAFCDALNDIGIKAELVSGATPREERAAIFARCHEGTTQVLCNCAVATEGTDVPRWSCAVIARPTQSAGLYQQMVGRILRPYPGQGAGQLIEKALVLDVAGVTRRHRLASLVDLTGRTFRKPVELDESLVEHDDIELELDALDLRNAEQGLGLEQEYVTGPTTVVEVDLFAGSRQQWLQTEGGTWFLAAGPSYYVFLAPAEPGTYTVTWCHKYRRGPNTGGFTEHANIDLSAAMAWGEDKAAEQPGFEHIASKKSSWRKRPASQRSINMARGLGIDVDALFPFGETITGDMVSNLISTKEATNRIDTIVAKMAARKGRA